MLNIRRVSFVATNFYRLSFNAKRFKSKDSKSDFNREMLKFDEKSSKQRNKSPSSNKENLQSQNDLNKTKMSSPKQSPTKKVRPQIILDTESNEVQTLTRQLADSLAGNNAPTERNNIEQDLLDALRGHRITSKTNRRNETKPKPNDEQQQQTKPKTQKENVSDAFSSLLRDINLQTSRPQPDPNENIDPIINDRGSSSRLDNVIDQRSVTRRPSRDSKRRQEYFRPHQLWSKEALGIFDVDSTKNDSSLNASPIWAQAEEEDFKRISMVPPRNAFEEMIQWTKDGILWKFPIDNEQDIGAEREVPFYDHVLLERHLNDFPKNPLIRQFMELVCIGLGRNPYWTAAEKREHIDWFRSYFNEKLNIFNETVHTGTVKSSSGATPKPVSTYKPKATPTSSAGTAAPVKK